LRAAAREPTAEEVEEGQERLDETGELSLPADEELGDVEDLDADASGDEEGGLELEPGLADAEREE
jgi:hypothetical protein